MKKRLLSLAALVLVLSMVFALAACGDKDNKTTTTAPTDVEETTLDDVQADATTAGTVEDDTTVDSTVGTTNAVTTDAATTALDETTAADATTVAGETTTAAEKKAPATKEEIVAYFNTAANAVKTDKPGYSKTTDNVIGDITSSNSLIESLAGKVVPMFPTEGDPETVAKGASHNNFPVKGKSWSSKLEASSVKSATCKESGKFYEIEIKLVDEKLNDLPSDPGATKHGKAMTVLAAPEVYEQTDKIPSFLVKIQSFKPSYTGSYIKCKINAETGKMVSATYYFATVASVDAKVVGGSLTATVPFAIKETFTIKY